MGSSGIRRRKPVQHLPKLPNGSDDAIPPNIMWPEAGSGFDASAVSPAGGAKAQWGLVRSLTRGRTLPRDRPSRLTFVVLVAVWSAIVGGIALLAHFHG